MKAIAACAVVALLGLAPVSALADTIITFGQTSQDNTLTGTGGLTGTTISGSDIAVSVSQIDAAISAPFNAFFDLDASSTSGATQTPAGSEVVVVQHFAGTFSICSTAACAVGDTNYLSGTFSDAALSTLGGTQIVLGASTTTFTSDVIAVLDLPRSIGFSLTNVIPPVSVTACLACDTGQTIASFTASVAGNASANAVPEPASFLILGGSLLAMGASGWRRRCLKTRSNFA